MDVNHLPEATAFTTESGGEVSLDLLDDGATVRIEVTDDRHTAPAPEDRYAVDGDVNDLIAMVDLTLDEARRLHLHLTGLLLRADAAQTDD